MLSAAMAGVVINGAVFSRKRDPTARDSRSHVRDSAVRRGHTREGERARRKIRVYRMAETGTAVALAVRERCASRDQSGPRCARTECSMPEAPTNAAFWGERSREMSRRAEGRRSGKPPAMHVATVNLRVKDDKRSEALSAIDGFIRRMHTWPGCLTCRLMADAGDSQLLTLVSEWDSREALDGFISSREFLILQGMRMVLRDDPQVILDEILLRSRMSLGARSR